MQRRRPATVTAAAILLAVTGLGYVITGGALFGQAGRAGERAGELSGGLMEEFAASATGILAVLTIAVGLTLLGTANAIRSGSQAGRVFAWVVMGLLLFCGLGGTRSGAPDLAGNVQLRVWQSDGSVRRQVSSETLPDAYSTTYRVISGSFAVFAMLAMIVAIILLTRPSAGRWFRPAASRSDYYPIPYGQTGPFPAPPPAMPYGVAQPSALYLGPPPSAPYGGPPPSAPYSGPPPTASQFGPPHAAPQFGSLPAAGPAPAASYGGPPPAVPGGGPAWSRPVEGPGSARQPRAAVDAELAVLTRRHQRGEITDADYAAARTRLTGN